MAPERGAQPGSRSGQLGRRLVGGLREVALLPVIGVLIVIGTVINTNFLQFNNFTEIGQFSSSLGVTVVGESLVLLTGGMDLSLESTYGLAPMVGAWMILSTNLFGNGVMLNPYLALLVVLAVEPPSGCSTACSSSRHGSTASSSPSP
jgi:ribose/xylose/arabinose/galactoside ABC-type transport system permease subunit